MKTDTSPNSPIRSPADSHTRSTLEATSAPSPSLRCPDAGRSPAAGAASRKSLSRCSLQDLRELWRGRSASQPLDSSPNRIPPANLRREALPDAVFIDLETRSACDISEGGRRYAEHPTTELMTAVAIIDGRVIAWCPVLNEPLPASNLWPEGFEAYGYKRLPIESFAGPELPPPLRQAIEAQRPLCAHNAADFDARVWRSLGLPEPVSWLDTLPHARSAGLPGKLEEIGQRLIGRGKDKKGSALVKRYCKPTAKGEFLPMTKNITVEIIGYNIGDVLLLSTIFHTVWGNAEPDIIKTDEIINQRGVAFDRELAEQLIALSQRQIKDITGRMEELTDSKVTRADLNRTEFLRTWLQSRGVALPNLQRNTLTRFLNRCAAGDVEADPAVLAVIEARLVASRTSGKKLTKALAALDGDGRLRDLLLYHKGHTGRWAGRGVQPQNLPRPHKDLHDVESLLDAVHDFDAFQSRLPDSVGMEEGLMALIRPCFRASPGNVLCISDFASVEARGVAWCAGESSLLEKFAQGMDVYCDLASQLYGCSVSSADKAKRSVGKVAVLGCGYGMGAKRFDQQAETQGLDLEAAGISAEEVVEGYRDAYPAIAGAKDEANGQSWRQGGLWRDLEQAARDAIRTGGTHQAGRCSFCYDGTSLVVTLPSGREMRYRNARIERMVPGYCKTLGLQPVLKPTVVYEHPQHGATATYGGELAENIVQAICRDLLAAAILECERQILPVVLHVHDEIVVEVPQHQADDAVRQLAKIMSTPPSWAEGFPIEVEAFTAQRYFKSPPRGARLLKARNGSIL